MQFNTQRRKFLHTSLSTSLTFIGAGALLSACQSENKQESTSDNPAQESASTTSTATSIDDCHDFTDVPAAELEKRKALGYEEVTPFTDKQCDNCQLFIPAKEGKKCGGCMLFKGPVFDNAHCTYWAPQTDA